MITRRTALSSTALALGAALALSACGDEGDAGAAGTPSDQGGADGAFPVTITHIYGDALIPAAPQRVVTIGWMAEDIIAALGIAPVASPQVWGGDEEGFTPWYRTRIEEVIGAPMPEILGSDDEGAPDYEQILGLAPDLIFAPHSGITEVQYARLSEIAPTIAPTTSVWGPDDWHDLTVLAGTALGKADDAARLIADTDAAIAEAAAAHPQLEGTSFLYGLTLNEGATELGLYASWDPRVVLLRQLGLVDSPSLAALEGDEESFNSGVSLEELDTLDAALFVGWSSGPEYTDQTLADALFSRWAPIASGSYYLLEDATMGMATNGPSVLSIAWAIENGFVDDLAAAVDGGAVVRSAAS